MGTKMAFRRSMDSSEKILFVTILEKAYINGKATPKSGVSRINNYC